MHFFRGLTVQAGGGWGKIPRAVVVVSTIVVVVVGIMRAAKAIGVVIVESVGKVQHDARSSPPQWTRQTGEATMQKSSEMRTRW